MESSTTQSCFDKLCIWVTLRSGSASFGSCEGQMCEFGPSRSAGKTGGIFGDSGVSYSKGVEDLLATAFGATQQAKPVNQANVDQFAGEIFDKASKLVTGQ